MRVSQIFQKKVPDWKQIYTCSPKPMKTCPISLERRWNDLCFAVQDCQVSSTSSLLTALAQVQWTLVSHCSSPLKWVYIGKTQKQGANFFDLRPVPQIIWIWKLYTTVKKRSYSFKCRLRQLTTVYHGFKWEVKICEKFQIFTVILHA